MRYLITFLFTLLSLYSSATGTDSTRSIMFQDNEAPEISLNIKVNNQRLASDAIIVLATGVALTTAGILLEGDLRRSNIPDGYHGHSVRNNRIFNYSVLTLGIGLNITGGVMMIKAFK